MTIFLGCSTSARLAAWLRARGALIFPAIPGVPFDPYHPGAYTAEELYNDIGEGYHVTLDAAIDRWRAAWPLRHDCATPSPLLCMTTR